MPRRLLVAGFVATMLVSGCSEDTPSIGVFPSSDAAGYTAPSGPGDPVYYNAIQYQYDQGDCGGLDSIIQGWQEPPSDPYADSYISEAERAKTALRCS